ncbi:MAG: hypothetical protein FJX62_10355 [Alphaproteobacteria bacterium]|nr:hypothetical protein [Alphaproteobacteria bacterium]
MLVAEIFVGLILFAIGSYVFWRIGQPDGVSLRLRKLPGIESLVVMTVLGGWAGGASFIVHAVAMMIAP